MPVLISLLRGINLAGHHKVPMEDLRGVYESLGIRGARTLLQSGNVVCKTRAQDLSKLSDRIEAALEQRFGFRPDVVFRTADELKAVIANNPFAGRTGIDPARLAVHFLKGHPADAAAEKIAAIGADPEELHLVGRELFIYFPDGMGRTKLRFNAVDKALGTPVTARNWNTVTKLVDMAGQME